MVDVAFFTFNNGIKIPAIGMGCWMGEPGGGERAYEMCKKALSVGYRAFDTAAGYGNEEDVGRALRESGIPREELFVTTKLPNTAHGKVRETFKASLQALDVGYIDLYLVHWPQATQTSFYAGALPADASPTIEETWADMEALLETGKVRAIGISNFGAPLVERLLRSAKVTPVTNQVEMHPCLLQEELKKVCESKGIILTAYSPLGQGPFFGTEPTILRISKELHTSPAQVVLAWAYQRGTIVVPKSENLERMTANISPIKLSKEHMDAIDAIHKQPGQHRSLLGYHNKDDNSVFGWTYEQLGWNMTTGGVVPQ